MALKALSKSFNLPEIMAVKTSDLAEVFAPFSTENKDPKAALVAAIDGTIEWLADGFKNESYKGSLYYGLQDSLKAIRSAVASASPGAETVRIKREHLEMLRATCCQLEEAAIQVGGLSAAQARTTLRLAFANYGFGHAPDEMKHKGDLLRGVSANLEGFFNKYPVAEAGNDAIDKFMLDTNPAPYLPGQKFH